MIDFAIDLAKTAGSIAENYFDKQLKIHYKPDNSPVTRADREAEMAVRSLIKAKFPDHGIIGEEHGKVNENAKYVWVIDPIDGTKDFVRGIPLWNTLVSLMENGRPIIGVIFSPTNHELLTAQKGKGAYLNGKKTMVSKTSEIGFSVVSHHSIKDVFKENHLNGLINLAHHCKSSRSYASYANNLILRGKIDIMISLRGAIYDYAAPAILIEEAGGKFTNIKGDYSITSGNAILTNGILHSQVLKLLNSKN